MEFRIKDIFSNYLRHQDINDYLDYLGNKYPKLTNVIVIGNSYEGRPLKSIKISYQTLNTKNQRKQNVTAKITKSNLLNKSTEKINNINRNSDSIKNCQLSKKSIVLIDGGLHAREWISIASALYCIYQLTEKYKRNILLLEQLDFYIIPLVNVDGYEYTHTNVSMFSINILMYNYKIMC